MAWAISQDLASQAMDVAKGTKGFDEVVDAIREHEMQILDSLVSSPAAAAQDVSSPGCWVQMMAADFKVATSNACIPHSCQGNKSSRQQAC